MTRLPFDPDLAIQHDEGPFDDRSRRGRRRFRRSVGPVTAVAVGGVVGGCARYGVDQLVPTRQGGFPWGTFAVNVGGAFLLALLLILVLEVWRPTRYVSPLLAVGVLGSFTTFSTLMVDVDQLFADGDAMMAGTYLAASITAGLAATSAGLVIGRGISTRGPASAPQETK